MRPTVALIDGDVLVYRTAFAGQKTAYTARLEDGSIHGPFLGKTAYSEWLASTAGNSPPVEVISEIVLDPVHHVWHSLDSQMESIVRNAGCSSYEVYLTGKENFRTGIAKTLPYKGNRTQPKPEYYDTVRERLQERYGAVVVDGIEADDALAIRATELPGAVICSVDKDLRQVPGLHYNWTKEVGVEVVDEADAEFHLYQQILTGDMTDNVPGLTGIGPVKAGKLLFDESREKWDEMILREYTREFGEAGPERAAEVRSLVYILRSYEEIPDAGQAQAERDPEAQESVPAEAEAPVPAV